MYIVEVKTDRGFMFVEELTATTLTLTENWRKAQKFHVNDLPNREEIDSSGITVIGYAPV